MAVDLKTAQRYAHQAYSLSKHVPIIGKHIGRIGRIVNIFNSPCSADSTTMFMAFIASAPDALLFAVSTAATPELQAENVDHALSWTWRAASAKSSA